MNASKKPIMMIIVLVVFLTGCAGRSSLPTTEIVQDTVKMSDTVQTTIASEETIESATKDTTQETNTPTTTSIPAESEAGEKNSVTPYQFLNLICGNAEELSYLYEIEEPGSGHYFTASYQRSGDVSVNQFKALDMNGNIISVRLLEMDGKAHYIMDDSRIVKTYLAPAENIQAQMSKAVNTEVISMITDEGFDVFEYKIPYVNDENMFTTYRFIMKDNSLQKMIVAFEDGSETKYQFSEFRQEMIDDTLFTYPKGYDSEVYDYIYDGEHMPPWWDVGNAP